tara:strand:+ start:14376 stop:15104 length:729 start_codon:yes stop_codon:yes gene_type:complete
MKIIKHFLFIGLFATTLGFSQNGGKNFIDQPYIEVTGQVETEIIPNEIYLNITINENDKKGKISIEEQENQMIAILKSLSLDLDKNFSILDFNGHYKRKIFADNEVTKIKNYELIINNGETLGKVYEALDNIDISNISITKVSHSEIETYKREAKLKALKIAKLKANQYANAIGQTIGKALFIEERQNFNNSFNGLSGNVNGIMIRGASTNYSEKSSFEKIQDLNFKKIIITATVLAKFILI